MFGNSVSWVVTGSQGASSNPFQTQDKEKKKPKRDKEQQKTGKLRGTDERSFRGANRGRGNTFPKNENTFRGRGQSRGRSNRGDRSERGKTFSVIQNDSSEATNTQGNRKTYTRGRGRGGERGGGRGRGNRGGAKNLSATTQPRNKKKVTDPDGNVITFSTEVPVNNPLGQKGPRTKNTKIESPDQRSSRDKQSLLPKEAIIKHIKNKSPKKQRQQQQTRKNPRVVRGLFSAIQGPTNDDEYDESEEEEESEDFNSYPNQKITFTVANTTNSEEEEDEEDAEVAEYYDSEEGENEEELSGSSTNEQTTTTAAPIFNFEKQQIQNTRSSSQATRGLSPSPIESPRIRKALRHLDDAMEGCAGSVFVPTKPKTSNIRYSTPTIWKAPTNQNQAIQEATKQIGKKTGKCTEKCSTLEFNNREDLFSVFELDNNKKPSRTLAVAKYSRPASNEYLEVTEALRTHDALVETANYLLRSIPDLPDDVYSFEDKSEFLLDRFRAIRMEITVQGVYTAEIAQILENMIRFIIIVSYRTLGSSKVDAKLLSDAFSNTILTLRDHAYTECHSRGIFCPNEAEMAAYAFVWDQDPMLDLHDDNIIQNEAIQHAIRINEIIQSKNYISFFREVKRVPVLFAMLMFSRHANNIRINALEIIRASYLRSQTQRIRTIESFLAFDNENQAIDFLAQFDIHPIEAGAQDDEFRFTGSLKKVAAPKLFKSKNIDLRILDYSMEFLSMHCAYMKTNNILNNLNTKPPAIKESATILFPPVKEISPPKPLPPKPSLVTVPPVFKVIETPEVITVEAVVEEIPKNLEIEASAPSPEDEAVALALQQFIEYAKDLTNELQAYNEQLEALEEEKILYFEMEEKVRKHLENKPRTFLLDSFRRWNTFTNRAKDFQKQTQSQTNTRGRITLPNVFGEISFTTPRQQVIPNLQDALEQAKKLLLPINLAELIGTNLAQKNQKSNNLYMKLSVCSVLPNLSNQFAFLSPYHWLYEKLRYPRDNSEPVETVEGISLFSFYETKISSLRRCKISCNWITPPIINPRDSLRSTQALLFLVHRGASLESQTEYFSNFIEIHDSSLPVTLCILNATELSNDDILVHLEVENIVAQYNRTVTNWKIVSVPVDEFCRVSPVVADRNLCKSMKWLSETMLPQPNLQGIEIRELVESFVDSRAFLPFTRFSECQRVNPCVITKMYSKALSYAYNTIKTYNDKTVDWPIQDFVHETSNRSVLPTDPHFDPDKDAGESYFMWNDNSIFLRLQSQLEQLQLADIPEIDLFDYEECSKCAIAFVNFSFNAGDAETETEIFQESLRFVVTATNALIKTYRSSGVFPWKKFLCSVFDMKLKILESKEKREKQIYFYLDSLESSPSLSTISLLQERLLNQNINVDYQYKAETEGTKIENILEPENEKVDELTHFEPDIDPLSIYSLDTSYIVDSPEFPPTKRAKMDENDMFASVHEFWDLLNETHHADEELQKQMQDFRSF